MPSLAPEEDRIVSVVSSHLSLHHLERPLHLLISSSPRSPASESPSTPRHVRDSPVGSRPARSSASLAAAPRVSTSHPRTSHRIPTSGLRVAPRFFSRLDGTLRTHPSRRRTTDRTRTTCAALPLQRVPAVVAAKQQQLQPKLSSSARSSTLSAAAAAARSSSPFLPSPVPDAPRVIKPRQTGIQSCPCLWG